MVLIVVELTLFGKLLDHFLLLLFQIDLLELSLDFIWVRFDALFVDPSVVSPVDTEVVNVILVPHRLLKLLDLFVIDILNLFVIIHALLLFAFSLFLSFELVDLSLQVTFLIFIFGKNFRMIHHIDIVIKNNFLCLIFFDRLLEKQCLPNLIDLCHSPIHIVTHETKHLGVSLVCSWKICVIVFVSGCLVNVITILAHAFPLFLGCLGAIHFKIFFVFIIIIFISPHT